MGGIISGVFRGRERKGNQKRGGGYAKREKGEKGTGDMRNPIPNNARKIINFC